MKKILLVAICCLISIHNFAQGYPGNVPSVSVTGKVIDQDSKQALEYATIIFSPLKGKKITGGITDENGNFSIDVRKGQYNISIEYISFKTLKLKTRSINQDTNLGTIALQTDSEMLDAVEIIAEKSTVEIRLDKKIYNVGKDMTVKGGSASDVLDNVPSVTVDVEGNVSLRGNENVRILINGKPSGLVGLSGTDALRQLPADAIQKVEVITSPSARYAAEGTAGIINIILRKGKALGFNGSASITSGDPFQLSGTVNLNYRTKKVNFFSNFGYSDSETPGHSNSYVSYLDTDQDTKFRNEDRVYDRDRNRFNASGGMEVFISDDSNITLSGVYRKSKSDDLSTNSIVELDANKVIINNKDRLDAEKEIDESYQVSLNYTKDFNDKGHQLTLDVQYNKSEEDESSDISENFFYPVIGSEISERTSTDEKSKDYLLKGDYVLPIGENSQFEFGFKGDFNRLTSDYLVEDYDQETGNFINNTDFSNNLLFNQDIYSVYTQYGSKINQFSYLFGLRAEITNRLIEVSNESYKKDYAELFPTVNLGYEINDTESFTVGYSRRLRRPRHWFLNPFESRTSETYIFTGNVELDPSYSNSFEIGYLKKWDKLSLNSSVYYNHSINNYEMVQREQMRDLDGNGSKETLVIIRKPINLSSQDRIGFEFTANYNPFKALRLSSSFNFYQFETDGMDVYTNSDNEEVIVDYSTKSTSWFTRLTARVKLPGSIEWQTRGMYMGPRKTAQSDRKGMVMVSMAFSKDILKSNGTLSLNVSDLFNTRKRQSTNYTATTITEGEFQWRERQITATFTYRFKQKKKRERGGSYQGGEGEDGMM